ncbi:MAG: glycosyltransferase family 4 protein [Betaproteobacteria bacterium]|nr:glycosyltransferase family 4 protein [Betaproteobacteria bacterium]
MASSEVRPFWLVVDIRSAASDRYSGLARFVIGLSQALGEALSARRSQNDPQTENVKVLLVAKSEPPKWAIELIQEYPALISFWSGGPGALHQSWDKPQYLWSSRVLRWIMRWSGGRFFWIAPGNFDRPVLSAFLLPRALRSNIVQVIHDTIPLDHSRSMGFLFRMQFSILVRRTLARLPFVFTVSEDSAARLSKLAPRRTLPIHILPSGIESIFGALPRFRSVSELASARHQFLDRLRSQAISESESGFAQLSSEEMDALTRKRWVVGVGRSQKYKGWEVAEEAVQQLNSDLSEGVVFIRIGGDEDGQSSHSQSAQRSSRSTQQVGSSAQQLLVRLNNSGSMNIESLADDLLAQLYRCSDVLVHPSQAEGFGFPPVEAALSGLPVIFRAGTAVDGHFQGHSFHPQFWQRIDSDSPGEWRNALLGVLRNRSGLDGFFDEMHLAVHPRAFICQRGGGQDFRWGRAAESLLNTLFRPKQEEVAAVGESQS